MQKNADVLNSWKEIAVYIGCGVRTAQRWASDLGMPVHRPRERSRSAVLGFKSEIETWARSRGDATLVLKVHAIGLSEAVLKLEQTLLERVGESAAIAEMDLLIRLDGQDAAGLKCLKRSVA